MTPCPICLEEKEEEVIQLDACSHEFCKQCLITWLENSESCPKCRRIIEQCEFRRIMGRLFVDPKNEERTTGLDAFTLTWLQDNHARQCPACGVWITRYRGCNFMVCHCRCSFDFDFALHARDWDGRTPALEVVYALGNYEAMKQILRHHSSDTLPQVAKDVFAQVCVKQDINGAQILLKHGDSPQLLHDAVSGACQQDNSLAIRMLLHLKSSGWLQREMSDDSIDSLTGESSEATSQSIMQNQSCSNLLCYLVSDENDGQRAIECCLTEGNVQIAIEVAINILENLLTLERTASFWMSANVQRIIVRACQDGDYCVVRTLLTANPDLVNSVDERGLSCLGHAVAHGNTDTIKLLLSRGAKVDVHRLRYQNVSLAQALQMADQEGNRPRKQWLLSLFPALQDKASMA